MENIQSRQQIIWIRNIDPSTGRVFYTSTEGSITLSNTSVDFATTASYALNGGSGGGSTSTGSLLMTASFSNPSLTFTKGDGTTFNVSLNSLTVVSASFASTASYFSGSVLNAISSSYALSASYATQAGNTNTININSFSAPVDSYLLISNVIATPGVAIGGDADLRYNASTNVLTVPNISATTLTGSLLGTASYASQALSSSNSLTSSYVLNAVSASFASTASYTLNAISSSYSLFSANSDRATTSSYSVTSTSASFSSTSSFVNTLNQNVLITGSLTVGITSSGPVENTLTLGARDNGSEGGQLGLNAPGGTYTSASFLDNWQNKLRILKGTNANSTAEVASWDLQTLYMTLPGGAITMPSRPAFRVTGSSGYNPAVNTVLSGSGIGIDYNQGSYYNNTNGQFTCPVAGLYHVWYVGRTFNASLASVALYKNGGGVPLAFWESNTNSGHFGVSAIVNMAVNDVITAKVTAGQVTFDGNDNWGVAYIG